MQALWGDDGVKQNRRWVLKAGAAALPASVLPAAAAFDVAAVAAPAVPPATTPVRLDDGGVRLSGVEVYPEEQPMAAIKSQWLTPNEVREWEDLAPQKGFEGFTRPKRPT